MNEANVASTSATPSATERIAEWLGDDPPRLVGVLATLVGSFGAGARLGVDDVEPFLGEAGGVPPWELTDALDKGDIRASLAKLHRMTEGGGRHALQIMATLQNHYGRMLMLDGADVAGEKDAAPHDALYWRYDEQWAIRTGDHKLIRADTTRPPMLFDLSGDPGESTDLAAREPETAKKLQAKYDQWSKSLPEPLWRDLPEARAGARRARELAP